MLIWSGLGFLVAAIFVACMFVTQLLVDGVSHNDKYWETHAWPGVAAMALAAGLVWMFNRWLEQRPGKRLIDPATNKEVVLRPRHSLFFIPVKYWPIVLVFIGVSFAFMK